MFDSLDVPVFDRADIVVAGGGPAGIAASLAATRLGKSVILLEQTGSAGGMSTTPCPSWPSSDRPTRASPRF